MAASIPRQGPFFVSYLLVNVKYRMNKKKVFIFI